MTVKSSVAWSGREKKSGLQLVQRSHLLLPAKPSLGLGLGNLMSGHTSGSVPVLTQEKRAGVPISVTQTPEHTSPEKRGPPG